MKKALLAGALALSLGGCAAVNRVLDSVETACARENAAHQTYMLMIAPFRPADKVVKAQAFHAKVQTACAILAPMSQIEAASNAADAARRQ